MVPSENGGVVLWRLGFTSDLWLYMPVQGTRCDALYHGFESQLTGANLLLCLCIAGKVLIDISCS